MGKVERKVGVSRASALLLAGLVALLSIACDSACESAKEKLNGECKDEIDRALHDEGVAEPAFGWGSDSCSEDEECVADCVNDADCEPLAYVLARGLNYGAADAPDGSSEVASCFEACVRSSAHAELD